MNRLKIAVAQMNTTPGAFDGTVAAMLAYGNQAAEQGCDLVVYPAPALMGPDPQSLVASDSFMLDVTLALRRLADGLKIDALVPFVSLAEATPRFDVAFISEGCAVAVSAIEEGKPMSMDVLNGRGIAAEAVRPRPLMPGPAQVIEPATFNYHDVTLGVALAFSDLEEFAMGDINADVICLMPVDSFDVDDERTCLAPSVADGYYADDVEDANAWLVAAGAAGAYDDMVYVGGSFVMAPWGELAAAAPSHAEDLLVYELGVLDEGPLENPAEFPNFERGSFMWETLVHAVRDQVAKRGLSGVALVADGTLASSAAAALAVDAVGPLRVHALVSAADDALADARALVRALRIRDVDEASARDLDRAAASLGGDDDADLVPALLEVRLGALARGEELLALSCADKTELAVGDAAGRFVARAEAFAPFGDVYRSDVARAARWRNTVSPVIGAGCLARLCVPTGLGLENVATSDEGRLSELDALLLMLVERCVDMSTLFQSRLGEQGVSRVLARLRARESSRRQGPFYPVVSACSLAEFTAPAACGWTDHRASDEAIAARDSFISSEPRSGYSRHAAALTDAPAAGGSTADGLPLIPTGPDFTISDEVREQIGPKATELMGYLKELADGRRLRSDSDKPAKGGPEAFMESLFSDN